MRIHPQRLRIPLVQRIDVSLGGGHDDIGIRPLVVDDAPLFRQAHGDLTLRIGATGDVVNRITSSNGDKTKLYERFNDLIKKFEEENNYEYSYGGKKNDKKNDKKKSKKKSKKKRVTTAYKKKKRTMRKNKIKSKFKTAY